MAFRNWGISRMTKKLDARCLRTFPASLKYHDTATNPTVAWASIQLMPKSSTAYIRASGGLITCRSRSLEDPSAPSSVLMELAESLEMNTKLEVSVMVASLWIGKVSLVAVDTALNVLVRW